MSPRTSDSRGNQWQALCDQLTRGGRAPSSETLSRSGYNVRRKYIGSADAWWGWQRQFAPVGGVSLTMYTIAGHRSAVGNGRNRYITWTEERTMSEFRTVGIRHRIVTTLVVKRRYASHVTQPFRNMQPEGVRKLAGESTCEDLLIILSSF
jgi:hypothetical protein